MSSVVRIHEAKQLEHTKKKEVTDMRQIKFNYK